MSKPHSAAPGSHDSPLAWPEGIMGRVVLKYPQASAEIIDILRDGFDSYLFSVKLWGPDAPVAMPSKSVDEIWHNAMLHSRFYQKLCAERTGWFVHHDPGPLASLHPTRTHEQAERELDEIARAWVGSCLREGLDWLEDSLPSLFVADRLADPAGFHYSSDPDSSCMPLSRIQQRASELIAKQPPTWLAANPGAARSNAAAARFDRRRA